MSEEIKDKVIEKDEQEIDLIALVKRLWQKRKFILIVTGCFMVIGLFIAQFSPIVFTADSIIVPQGSSKSAGGSLSSLASMAGINLGDMTASETLSPKIYPAILQNVNFQKELMYKKIKFEKWEESVSLFDFYTNKEYIQFSLLEVVKRYTIGLPGMIIGAIRGEEKDKVGIIDTEYGLNTLSLKEAKCAKILSKVVMLDINEKGGYLTLTVNMPEALAAAQVAEDAYNLLQKYITEFKLQKAQANLDFINARYEDARKEFEEKQIAYAEYQDANRLLTSKVAGVKEEQMKSEYTLAITIYNELARQLLQANLKVKEDTPILTQVKPIIVPNIKSKPKKSQILVIWTFLGGVLGCGLVLGFDWLKGQGSSWPKKWDYVKPTASN